MQIGDSCTVSSATKAALMAIPGIDQHEAEALCMLGSLRDIASSSVADILSATDLTPSQ